MKLAESQEAVKRREAEGLAARKEIESETLKREAEAEAQKIRLLATAEYEAGVQQQKVAALMPAQELELKRIEWAVKGLEHFGHAAWRHPDEMQRFYEQLTPFLQLKGLPAQQLAGMALQAQPHMESTLPGQSIENMKGT